MSTFAGVLKPPLGEGLNNYPVLPPIPNTPVQDGAMGLSGAEERMTVQRKLLRHRRSKKQQHQLHKIV